MNRNSRLLSVIVSVAVLGLGGCSGAVPKEGENVETEVAVQVGTVMKADLRARVEAYGVVEPEPAKCGPSRAAARNLPRHSRVSWSRCTSSKARASRPVTSWSNSMTEWPRPRWTRHGMRWCLPSRWPIARTGSSPSGAHRCKRSRKRDQRLAAARAELASAQAAIAQVQLASPLDGVVARINVQPGQSVDLNTVVAEVIDLKRLVATVSVPADEATQLHARPDRGHIHRQCQEAGNDRHRVVRESVRGPEDRLRPWFGWHCRRIRDCDRASSSALGSSPRS